MKQQTAKLKYLKIAPRKVQLAANLLKGLAVNEAEAQLLMSSKRPNLALLKLLRSAVNNAKHNNQLNPERLFIKEIRVDQGPMLKRYLPRAMGRASPIQKKSSHITLILGESEKLKTPRFKIIKPEKISKKEKAEKIKRGVKPRKLNSVELRGKAERPKMAEPEKEKIKPAEKPGFIRRIFRRKSI